VDAYGIIVLISQWLIPVLILVILLIGSIKRLPTYELFVAGGKEGIKIAFSLLPFLVGMIVSISILRHSGALDAFIEWIGPFLSFVGFPKEVAPLAFIRPISGTAALSMTAELINEYGPDSFIGRLASTMQGSTDTTLYVLTVYFGAINVYRIRYALKVGLLTDLIGIIASIIIVTIVFG